jgi:hypothetical protein
VTQVGEGRGAAHGGPVVGELLAERYQLEQHINTDRTGRQIWYGVDVILRRPVAVVIRYPGGPAAGQMLQVAVEASRIVHPNLVGVYDAIDEQSRAYVVREWVDGASLRDYIASGAFDSERAVAVGHAVAAAVTAVHSTGMTHGNVHPGTVLIGRDGRVMLADAPADGMVPGEEDVRAVGAVLYYALTGLWPHSEVSGPDTLPDAMRDHHGALAAPRQVRAGVPDHLDNLIMDLLDRRLSVPPAEVLAGEMGRLDSPPEEVYYAEPDTDTGPVRLREQIPAPAASGRKIVLGVGALVLIAILGVMLGLNLLRSPSPGDSAGGPGGGSSPTATADGDGEVTPAQIALSPDQVRIVDSPEGNRAEVEGAEALVDGDPSTTWRTDQYRSDPRFGLLKEGMGILVDLGEPRQLASVKVEMTTGGAVAELRTGDDDPGATREGDQQIIASYAPLGEPVREGSTMVFSAFDKDTSYQYLMIWFTELPPDGDGYRVEVQQVTVEGF